MLSPPSRPDPQLHAVFALYTWRRKRAGSKCVSNTLPLWPTKVRNPETSPPTLLDSCIHFNVPLPVEVWYIFKTGTDFKTACQSNTALISQRRCGDSSQQVPQALALQQEQPWRRQTKPRQVLPIVNASRQVVFDSQLQRGAVAIRAAQRPNVSCV